LTHSKTSATISLENITIGWVMLVIDSKKLSNASIVRLQFLLELLEQYEREQRKYITSSEIGEVLGISPVNVRQDLFKLGSAGKPRIGYEVTHLIRLLRQLFDLDRPKKACIVGFWNLGRALAGSRIWEKAGYNLVALFDNDPSVIGTEAGALRVRNISEIFGVIRTEEIEMAVITVPASAAQEVADMVIAAGVKAIWNFAPVKLHTPPGIVVENQSLAWGLVTLSRRTKQILQEDKVESEIG
jgi:redox-sensing transcriptional repressor